MKTIVNYICWAATCFFLAATGVAQNVTPLVAFNGDNGSSPEAGLVASNTTLYGTTYGGGSSNFGTVFAAGLNGQPFSTLYNFTGANYNTNTGTYSTTDGAYPAGELLLTNGVLYGTTFSGGSSDDGTVFMMATNGGGYSVIHNFTGRSDGANPDAGLILSNNTLFGTAFVGGNYGNGCVFRMDSQGNAYTNLHSFAGGGDGANPEAGLVLSGATLYGTTYGPYFGQSSGHGSVFRVNIDGTGFATIYSFTGGTDGAFPQGSVTLSGATLYGTTSEDGTYFGTVFRVNTNGGSFAGYPLNGTAGANPAAGLILYGSTLYGTTPNGGTDGWGTIFSISTNGTGLTNLYNFTSGSDGASPVAPLMVFGTNFFGTTEGSEFSDGNAFSFPAPALPPVPSLFISGLPGKVVLTWTNSLSQLEATTNLSAGFTNIFGAISPYTNTTSDSQKFFRLH